MDLELTVMEEDAGLGPALALRLCGLLVLLGTNPERGGQDEPQGRRVSVRLLGAEPQALSASCWALMFKPWRKSLVLWASGRWG